MIARPWLALALAFVVTCAIYALGRPDFLASDPLWYASIAHRMAADAGSVFAGHDLHPFVMRIGLTAPLALAYRLFGVSSATTNLPSLLAALAILATIYTAMPSPRGKLIGLGVGVLSTALMQNAVILNVDLPCAALMGLTVLCLDRRWLVAAAATWFAAFLVKEVAVWCAPVWIYAIAVDLRALGRRALLARYAPTLVTGALLAVGYLALCDVLWGDPFARAHGIGALTDEHAWSLRGHPVGEWLARMIWQPPIMFAKLFQVTLVPALAAIWLARARAAIWLVALGAFAACYWFGSSSVSAYVPLPISPRMALPILPPLLVCAALGLDALADRWRLAAIAVAIAVAALPIRAIAGLVIRAHPEADAFAELRREASDGSPLEIVCAEPRCVAIADWYFGFATPANVRVVDAGAFAPPPAGTRVRVVVNRVRAIGAHRTDPSSEHTGAITALGLPVLAGNKNVTLYDAGDGRVLAAH